MEKIDTDLGFFSKPLNRDAAPLNSKTAFSNFSGLKHGMEKKFLKLFSHVWPKSFSWQCYSHRTETEILSWPNYTRALQKLSFCASPSTVSDLLSSKMLINLIHILCIYIPHISNSLMAVDNSSIEWDRKSADVKAPLAAAISPYLISPTHPIHA